MGALFASFMDEQAVETAGLDALGPDLEIVRGVTDAESLARALGTLQATGVAGLLMPFVDNDNEHPDRYSVYLEQHGIGLPDEAQAVVTPTAAYFAAKGGSVLSVPRREVYKWHSPFDLGPAGLARLTAEYTGADAVDLRRRLGAQGW